MTPYQRINWLYTLFRSTRLGSEHVCRKYRHNYRLNMNRIREFFHLDLHGTIAKINALHPLIAESQQIIKHPPICYFQDWLQQTYRELKRNWRSPMRAIKRQLWLQRFEPHSRGCQTDDSNRQTNNTHAQQHEYLSISQAVRRSRSVFFHIQIKQFDKTG